MFWLKCPFSLAHSLLPTAHRAPKKLIWKKHQRLLTLNSLFMFISLLYCDFNQKSPDVSLPRTQACVVLSSDSAPSLANFTEGVLVDGFLLSSSSARCKHKLGVGQAFPGSCGAYSIWILSLLSMSLILLVPSLLPVLVQGKVALFIRIFFHWAKEQ